MLTLYEGTYKDHAKDVLQSYQEMLQFLPKVITHKNMKWEYYICHVKNYIASDLMKQKLGLGFKLYNGKIPKPSKMRLQLKPKTEKEDAIE